MRQPRWITCPSITIAAIKSVQLNNAFLIVVFALILIYIRLCG